MQVSRYIFIGILLLLCSCFGENVNLNNTLTGNPVLIVGHAGSGFESVDNFYPINSKKSILQAIDIFGADGVEVDLQMTQDSVLFLYHDNLLESQTNCTFCVSDYLAEELAACNYRTNFATNVTQSEKVWTFEALLANFAARPDPPIINIDVTIPNGCQMGLESDSYFRTLARQISSLLKAYQADNWVYVEFAQLWQLEYMESIHPGLNLVWLGPVDEERLIIAEQKGLWGVVTENEKINKTQVEEAHRRGLGVIVYNVKIRSSTIEAIEKGVDLIETDNIPLCHSVMEQK